MVSAYRSGHAWTGTLPSMPGQVIEYRFRADIIAPDNLANPDPGDRPYAGSWYLGAHTHFDWRGFDVSAGADVVITGEQSGLRNFQSGVHDTLSMPRMDVENYQVEDGVYLNAVVELARDVAFAGGAIRPFVELQAGVENLARAGFDVTLGDFGQGGWRTRDPVTGQRVEGIDGELSSGWSFLVGGDIAYVDSSVFLPSAAGFEVEETRTRLRAGVNYGFGSSNIFYGVTYMSEEFVGQSEGQLVGSLSIGIDF